MKYLKRLWVISSGIFIFSVVFTLAVFTGEFDRAPLNPRKLLAELFAGGYDD